MSKPRGIVIAALVAWSACASASTATYCVRVVDADTGLPVKEVDVYGGFVMLSRGWDNTPLPNLDCAQTDVDGLCRVSGNTDKGESYFGTEKRHGYYDSRQGRLHFSGRSILKFGRWLPDDLTVTVRIDRIVRPIPLFAKRVGGVVYTKPLTPREPWCPSPYLYKDVVTTNRVAFSYDLAKGDWLPPYGAGEVADLTATCWKEITGYKTYEVPAGFKTVTNYLSHAEITFNGPDNGVCEVKPHELAGILIREAPDAGYSAGLSRWYERRGENNSDKNRHYCFRIRTRRDAEGRIVSALYGKVYGDFRINDLSGIAFTYYLNPTPNDRNLEFDRKTNFNLTDGRDPKDIAP